MEAFAITVLAIGVVILWLRTRDLSRRFNAVTRIIALEVEQSKEKIEELESKVDELERTLKPMDFEAWKIKEFEDKNDEDQLSRQ